MNMFPFGNSSEQECEPVWQRDSYDELSVVPTLQTADESGSDSVLRELRDLFRDWLDMQEISVQLLMLERRSRSRRGTEELLVELSHIVEAQAELLRSLSFEAREFLCQCRRVSMPGVQFEFFPADPGAGRESDSLVGWSALDLSAT
jgi:hypothetical protein